MAYIGAVAPGYDPTRASVPQLDAERFSGTGSATAFTLARQVVSPTDIDVVVENVTQEPTVAYSVNGNTLTFTEAPGSGTNNIYVIYRGSGISNYAFVPDGSITYAKLANNIKQFTVDAVTANGTGTTVELTEAPASANSIIVSVDGVIQTAPTNYTLSGSTITFTGTPDNGANVVVRHIGFRTTSTVTALQASSVTATEIADGSITNVKIVSVANTKITGNIASSQITSNPTLYGNVSVTGVIGVGGATPTSNGSGITFPASQSASSDANTLDDYEEGTWTPVVSDAATAGNLATLDAGSTSGVYTKIGNVVYWRFSVVLTSKASMTAGNDLFIQGFPFQSAAISGSWYNPCPTIIRNITFTDYVQFHQVGNTTRGTFRENVSNANGSDIIVSDLTDSAAMQASGFYRVA